MTEFLKCNAITHIRSTLYHPHTNGLVERMNRTVKEGIQVGKLEGTDPVTATREKLAAYHVTPNTATGKTPFELMRGLLAKTQLHIVPPNNVVSDHESVKSKVNKHQAKYKSYFDERPGIKQEKIDVGDYVRIKCPKHVQKGGVTYSEPIKVTQAHGPWVRLENGRKWNVCQLVQILNRKVNTKNDNVHKSKSMRAYSTWTII